MSSPKSGLRFTLAEKEIGENLTRHFTRFLGFRVLYARLLLKARLPRQIQDSWLVFKVQRRFVLRFLGWHMRAYDAAPKASFLYDMTTVAERADALALSSEAAPPTAASFADRFEAYLRFLLKRHALDIEREPQCALNCAAFVASLARASGHSATLLSELDAAAVEGEGSGDPDAHIDPQLLPHLKWLSPSVERIAQIIMPVETASAWASSAGTLNIEREVKRYHIAHSAANFEQVRRLLAAGFASDASFANGEALLTRAAAVCDIDAVELLLKFTAPINRVDATGDTPLCAALVAAVRQEEPLAKDAVRLVDLLLNRRGAEPNFARGAQRAPGMRASEVPLIALLEEQPAATHGNVLGCESARMGALKVLLSAGAATETARVSDGRTALGVAARWGNLACVQYLLRSGAAVDAIPRDGRSPLHLALGPGPGASAARVAAALLTAGADATLRSHKRKWNALHFACANAAPLHCVHAVMAQGTLRSAHAKEITVAQAKEAGDVWGLERTYAGDTGLHLVSRSDCEEEYDDVVLLSADERRTVRRAFGHSGCGERARRSNTERWAIIHRFVREGAAIDAPGSRRESVLHIACAQLDTDLLRRLVAPPPAPTSVAGDGAVSPSGGAAAAEVEAAAAEEGGFSEEDGTEEEDPERSAAEDDASDGAATAEAAHAAAAELYRPHLKVEPLDSRGRTPLMLTCISAAKFGATGAPLDWLPGAWLPGRRRPAALSEGAAYDARDLANTASVAPYDGTVEAAPDIAATLLRAGANPARADGRGITALMYIATSESLPALDLAELVLQWHDSDASENASEAAVRVASGTHCSPAEGGPLARVLAARARSLDINARDHSGKTALMRAAAAGATGMVELLLRYGADSSLVANVPSVADDEIGDSHCAAISSAELLASVALAAATSAGSGGGWDALERAVAGDAAAVVRLERIAMAAATARAEAAEAAAMVDAKVKPETMSGLALAEDAFAAVGEEALLSLGSPLVSTFLDRRYAEDGHLYTQVRGIIAFSFSGICARVLHSPHILAPPPPDAPCHRDHHTARSPRSPPLPSLHPNAPDATPTQEEFVVHYGGLDEWNVAEREFPLPAPPTAVKAAAMAARAATDGAGAADSAARTAHGAAHRAAQRAAQRSGPAEDVLVDESIVVLPFVAPRAPRDVLATLRTLVRADTGEARGAVEALPMLLHSASIFAECHGHAALAETLRRSEATTAREALARGLALRREAFFSALHGAAHCAIGARRAATRAMHHAVWAARHALYTSLKAPGWAGVPDPWSSVALGPSFSVVGKPRTARDGDDDGGGGGALGEASAFGAQTLGTLRSAPSFSFSTTSREPRARTPETVVVEGPDHLVPSLPFLSVSELKAGGAPAFSFATAPRDKAVRSASRDGRSAVHSHLGVSDISPSGGGAALPKSTRWNAAPSPDSATPGPGSYELTETRAPGPAFTLGERRCEKPIRRGVRDPRVTPGPGDYDLQKSFALVHGAANAGQSIPRASVEPKASATGSDDDAFSAPGPGSYAPEKWRRSRVLGGAAYAALSPVRDRTTKKDVALAEASFVYASRVALPSSFGHQASARFKNGTGARFGGGGNRTDMLLEEEVRAMRWADYMDKTNGAVSGRGPGAYDTESDYRQFVDEHIAEFGRPPSRADPGAVAHARAAEARRRYTEHET
jgi:ankyrin repeat protein